ncbi:hypothetical protein [uncultured Tolumonas sp.]|uniref:hypothetical protein n=1 Tax=uncultured Tolumonas sp. TaxID=263765 RepID=UPI002A0A1F5C|nr:hypothetical protein [uncultured Tolumonas sp.]
MPISKDKWKEIEDELKGYYLVNVKFKLGNDVISIARQRETESKTVLVVYINGKYSLQWQDEKHELFNPLTHKVWKKTSKRMMSQQKIAALKKKYGVRMFNQLYSKREQEAVISYFMPFFSSSRSLVSQFKKIDGLEFIGDGNDAS